MYANNKFYLINIFQITWGPCKVSCFSSFLTFLMCMFMSYATKVSREFMYNCLPVNIWFFFQDKKFLQKNFLGKKYICGKELFYSCKSHGKRSTKYGNTTFSTLMYLRMCGLFLFSEKKKFKFWMFFHLFQKQWIQFCRIRAERNSS